MNRTRILPSSNVRRTISLPAEVDVEVAVRAVRRRVPYSVALLDLLKEGIKGTCAAPSHRAREFPEEWDGKDLRSRLFDLRIRQKDICDQLGVNNRTFSGWVTGATPWKEGMLRLVQDLVINWTDEVPEGKFRWGSRSPSK